MAPVSIATMPLALVRTSLIALLWVIATAASSVTLWSLWSTVVQSVHTSRGQFSVVRECQHNTTRQIYAAKLVPIQVGHAHAQHELQMLSKLAHPNIVQIAAAYMTSDHYILIFQKVHLMQN